MPPDSAPLPPPPDYPDPRECCGRGCYPCIFDYYEIALERWKAAVIARGVDPVELLKAMGREP